MESLIKDLVGVALGNKEEEESRDERSRATWAEVVSSSGDNDSGENKQQQCQQPSDHWRRPEIASSGGDDNYGNIRQPEYEKPSGHWGRTEVESAEVEGSGDNEGEWETVGKKHKKHGLHQKVPVDCWDGYKQDPSKQNYADEFDGESNIQPSEEELSDLSQTCNKLWDLDTNRLIPGKDYAIDCGEGKKVYNKEDMASDNLFSWLTDDVFTRPTFSRFLSLLDNYNPDQGCKEVVTSQEKHEQVAFMEEISRTAPVKYLHKYLVARGVAPESYAEFKDMLRGLWFNLYARGGSCGSSSAFEHVFVGEIRNRGESEVSGFHNWIQFYLEEAKGRVDYQGYIFPRRRGEVPDSETQLLTIQFEWNGVLKSVSSSFIGVSPEFELALYTLCFFVGEEDNHVSLGPYYVNIKCYRLGDNRIGSVFPIAE